MSKKFLIAGIMALTALGAAAPASAQSLEFGRDGVQLRQDQPDRVERRGRQGNQLTERQAIRIAKGEGVRQVDDVSLTRNSYKIEGTDRRGDDIEVKVDRVSGEVLSVE